jgi:hypothetical protein
MIEVIDEFCAAFAEALAAAPPLCPKLGGIVPPSDVIGVHSESTAEDGHTITRLYDLRSGNTGAQSFLLGDAPGPIRYCCGTGFYL